jgi:hypothetical protein
MEIRIEPKENISDPIITTTTDDRKTINLESAENNEFDFLQNIKNSIYDEINFRIIVKRDKHALEILQSAKDKVKDNINIDTVKWALIAMKGFYLAASIALMNQRPELF